MMTSCSHGSQFDFSRSQDSQDFVKYVVNMEFRKKEVSQLIESALKNARLSKLEALVLRGKLGFADSFVHGKVGITLLEASGACVR